MSVEQRRTNNELTNPRGIHWASRTQTKAAVRAVVRIVNGRDSLPVDRTRLMTTVDQIRRGQVPDTPSTFSPACTKILNIKWDLAVVGYEGESLEELQQQGYPIDIGDDVKGLLPHLPRLHYRPRDVAYHPQLSFTADTLGRTFEQVRSRPSSIFEAVRKDFPDLTYGVTNPAIAAMILMDFMRRFSELPVSNYRTWVKITEDAGYYNYSRNGLVIGGVIDSESLNPGSRLVVSCMEKGIGEEHTGMFSVVESIYPTPTVNLRA